VRTLRSHSASRCVAFRRKYMMMERIHKYVDDDAAGAFRSALRDELFTERVETARTAALPEPLVEVILDWAYRSVANADAIYAAVQELRDLRELEPDEAACVCGGVYEILSDRFMTHDPAYQRILALYTDASVIEGVPPGKFESWLVRRRLRCGAASLSWRIW
jgi:hypothetical protein